MIVWLWLACEGPPTWKHDVGPLVEARCVGCHRAGEDPPPSGGFVLDGPERVIDQPSAQATMALVTPGDALHSYLWHKINGSQSVAGGAGTSMPIGGSLTDDEIQLVADWIDGGAE